MSKIDDLNIQPKFDNALQVQRTANIPNNEKYTASEWNSLISKTNEVVGRANLNTWSIVTNYSELPTDPVNGQKVYVTETGLSGHVGVQMMPNGNSSRGFYVYDAFSDIWVQKTSEADSGELKKIGDGYGLQHQIDNPDNYGTLGANAINLSFSNVEGDFGATGEASHAEGRNAKAIGNYSHAEGTSTTASGYASHTEGQGTTASGRSSHTEGQYTEASGLASHAEGNNTTASGDGSHAEGNFTTASGDGSHAEGGSTTAGSYAENARGAFNEIITPISETTFEPNDVIESVGVGTGTSVRKNALTRWKNGAFKWLLQPLTNITNAVLGFHAADEEGRLNYYDGTDWKKYLLEGEGSGGSYIEILDQFNDINGEIDLDLITEEGTYVLKTIRDEPLNGLPQYAGDGPSNVQVDVFKSGDHTDYTIQRVIYFSITQGKPSIAYRRKYGSGSYTDWFDSYEELEEKNFLREMNTQNYIRFWRGTQAEYDAITTKNPQTLYIDSNSGLIGNGVTPTIAASVITNYDIDIATQTEHWNLTMTGNTNFDFTNMFASGNSKVITITLEGDYAFAFPIWLKPLETNDEYDTIEGTLVAEIVINIKNGGATPQGYYSLQMIDYAL